MTSEPRYRDTGGRLAREWARLRTRPDHLASATDWGLTDDATRPLQSLDDVLAAVGFQQAPDRTADARLRRLVEIARDDELAARVVLQRIMPGLLAVVRRRRGMTDHVFEELVAAAWIAIRTFNPDRSPINTAAALISDADYAAFRAAGRRMSSTECPVDAQIDDRAHVHEPSACEQLAAVLAEGAAAGMTDDELELVRQLLETPTAIELAKVLQITPRTIRNRRDRITAKLRDITLVA